MFFKVLGRVVDRVFYEVVRVKKVGPFLVRWGLSELEDRVHRFKHWRGACDHDMTAGPRRGKRGAKRKKPLARK